ncbi:Neuromedin-U receptor 2 [Trichoplax sp. H2]|nr:Neuromedin-U receptor 2 [Trichoplax sp. H2]|eukprot:RDD37278.1 Neuromedin-U receptor 2 [Trichoplax sp. H2]
MHQSNTTQITDEYLIVSIAKVVIYSLLSIVGIIGNLFNLITIYQSPSLRTLNNAFLIALTINDFICATIGFPLQIATLLICNRLLCLTQATFVTTVNAYSVALTACVSIDRCHAVLAPYDYIRRSTRGKYIFLILSLIVTPIVLSVLPLTGLEDHGFGNYTRLYASTCWISLIVDKSNVIIITLFTTFITLTALIIMICYIILFSIAYNKSNRDLANQTGIRTSVRTVLLLVGTNMICWIPMSVITFIGLVQYYATKTSFIVHNVLSDVVLDLSCCNVALNPIIYLLTNSILRRKFKSLVRILTRKTRIEPLSYEGNQRPTASRNTRSSLFQSLISRRISYTVNKEKVIRDN